MVRPARDIRVSRFGRSPIATHPRRPPAVVALDPQRHSERLAQDVVAEDGRTGPSRERATFA
jgi:hypothetical protein